jgi:hypothetical protein
MGVVVGIELCVQNAPRGPLESGGLIFIYIHMYVHICIYVTPFHSRGTTGQRRI